MAARTPPVAGLTLSTPLGPDALVAVSLQGEERLSAPFEYVVQAEAADDGLDVAALPGGSADVTLTDGDGGETVLNAVIWSVRREGRSVTLTLRPWLSLLALSSDNRIFQDKTALDIVEAVVGDAGEVERAVAADPPSRSYCVQFGETDLAFVSRLLEAEGIGYFFSHEAGSHKLVVFDDASGCPELSGGALPFLPLEGRSGHLQDRRVSRLSARRGLAPGKWVVRDYAFERPAETLEASVGDGARGRYHYPGGHDAADAGAAVARLRLEAEEADAVALEGETPWRAVSAGLRLTFSDADEPDAAGEHLVRAVSRRAGDSGYAAVFDALPVATPFRPLRRTPRPRMAGPQTAVVVGPSGEEIWTDEHGRVKVQFHWDREGESDENASCWLRVAQVWAGAGWGAFVLPRIGQEVVVGFLDGDPDRPLVTGVVYNGTNAPPYALPAEQTKTVLKSDSSKDAEGSNELRFEDKAGEEEVFLHAQKDLTIEIENARTTTLNEGDDALTVSKGARTVEVTEGDESLTVGGKRTVKVTGDETRTNEAKLTHTVTGDMVLTVKGGLTIKVSGDVAIQADGGLNLKSGGAFSIAAGGAFSLSAGSSASIAAGTSVEISGGSTLTAKGSASAEVSGGGMLTLKGGVVKVN